MNENLPEAQSELRIPLQQRVYWIIMPLVAIVTAAVGLMGLELWVSETHLRILLIAIGIGLLLLLHIIKPDKQRRVSWVKAVGGLMERRSKVEYLFFECVERRRAPTESVYNVWVLARAIIMNRAFLRAVHRMALVENEKDLAADLLLEIGEYTEWLQKLRDRLYEIEATE